MEVLGCSRFCLVRMVHRMYHRINNRHECKLDTLHFSTHTSNRALYDAPHSSHSGYLTSYGDRLKVLDCVLA